MVKLFLFLSFGIATFWTTISCTNAETVSTQASKKILIAPKFDTSFVWSQKIEASTVYEYEGGIQIQDINLTMKGRIDKIKDSKPASIVFTNVSGEQYITENDDEIDRTENVNGKITATIDNNFCLINEKDYGKLSNDIFLAYSPGSFIGFKPTNEKIKIGESWSSGTVIPLGEKTFKKKKFQFSDIEGNFTLIKHANSIASIEWRGTASATDKSGNIYEVSWFRQVEFDTNSYFFKSNKGNIDFQSDQLQISYKVDVIAKF